MYLCDAWLAFNASVSSDNTSIVFSFPLTAGKGSGTQKNNLHIRVLRSMTLA